MFHKMKPETLERRKREREIERRINYNDLTSRIYQAYVDEPDREYAEEMWGSMLDERCPDWREAHKNCGG